MCTLYITYFTNLIGSIKYAKKYINKYNTTKKKEKEEKKQELRLMFGYQPT